MWRIKSKIYCTFSRLIIYIRPYICTYKTFLILLLNHLHARYYWNKKTTDSESEDCSRLSRLTFRFTQENWRSMQLQPCRQRLSIEHYMHMYIHMEMYIFIVTIFLLCIYIYMQLFAKFFPYLCKRWQALNVSFRVRNATGCDIFTIFADDLSKALQFTAV